MKTRGSIKKGEVRNPKGRPKANREKFCWEFLDYTAIPAAIQYLHEIVSGTHDDLIALTPYQLAETKKDAAKALLAKAPARIEGPGDGGKFEISVETKQKAKTAIAHFLSNVAGKSND
jgi:hypothetical protein